MARTTGLSPSMKDALRVVRACHTGRGFRGATYQDLQECGVRSVTRNALERRGLIRFHFSRQGCVGERSTFRTTAKGKAVLAELEKEAARMAAVAFGGTA